MSAIRNILRNALPLAALEALSIGLALATIPYLMHVLGPVAFGHYALGVSAGAACATWVDYGFNQLGTKTVAQAPGQGSARSAIFWPIQLAKFQLALLVLPAMAAGVWAFGLTRDYGDVLRMAAAGAAGALVFPQWFLQGGSHYRTLALSLAVARTAASASTWLWVREPREAPSAVLIQVLVPCGATLIALTDRRYRDSVGMPTWRWTESWRYLLLGRPYFLSTVAVTTYTTCIPLLVGLLGMPTTVAMFGVGDRIRGAVQSLLAPIGVAAFPKISPLLQTDRALGLAALRKLLALQTGLGALAAIGMALLAGPVIERVAGPGFGAAVAVAQCLSLCLVCTAVSNTLGVQAMLSLNMQRPFATILSLCAIVGLMAVAVMTSVWGALGTAAGVVLTEVMVAALMAIHLRRHAVL